MKRFSISPAAMRDIRDLLERSLRDFGIDAAVRYNKLIHQGIADLVENPVRPGCHQLPLGDRIATTYHLRHSRRNVTPTGERVRRPRHFLLFRILDDGVIEISRVLHDRMDPQLNLPD
jgi:toxin ParE1/3/4